MKFDKETLTKQRFWVLLVAFLPLVLFAILFLWTVVDPGITGRQGDIETKKRELNSKGNLKGDQDVKTLNEVANKLEARKKELWEASWAVQKDLYTWPTGSGVDSDASQKLESALKDLNFGDPIPDSARAAYLMPKVYKPQIDQLGATFTTRLPVGLQNVDTDFQSTLFKDGWNARLRYVKNFYDAKVTSSPSSEEVWLAQEDFWVQRELLRAIQTTNEAVGRMPLVADSGVKPADGEAFRGQYRNASWQLELAARKSGPNYVLRGKLKNVSQRRMLAGKHYFSVKTSASSTPVVLLIDADALGVDQEWPIADYPVTLTANPVKQEVEVAQLYDSKEAPSRPPIRRIDRIELGYHAHRTVAPLKPDPKLVPPKKEVKAPPTGTPGGPGPGSGPAPGTRPGAPEGRGDQITENGMPRDRYSDVTGQVRRMPLGMVLVVDQASIPELLSALANSKIRLQVTQVDWTHARGLGRSTEGGDHGRPQPPVGGPQPPVGGPPTPETRTTPEAGDENLVELAVYGIASLFERVPPKSTGVPAPR